MGFKFYTPNLFLTTSAFTVFTGDGPAVTDTSIIDFDRLLDRKTDPELEWSQGAGWTVPTILQADIASVAASAIILQNMSNLSDFFLKINDSTFEMLNYGSADSVFVSNTSKNIIVEFATQTVTRVQLFAVNAGDYYLGEMILANLEFELPHNPSFANYKPLLTGNKISKVMADGGVANYKLKEKFAADIDLNLVDASTASDLYDLYSTQAAHLFVPLETNSAWDGDAYEINFCGNWDLKQFAVNDLSQPYFKGGLSLKETPV